MSFFILFGFSIIMLHVSDWNIMRNISKRYPIEWTAFPKQPIHIRDGREIPGSHSLSEAEHRFSILNTRTKVSESTCAHWALWVYELWAFGVLGCCIIIWICMKAVGHKPIKANPREPLRARHTCVTLSFLLFYFPFSSHSFSFIKIKISFISRCDASHFS